MAYFFFSGSMRGHPAGASITLRPISVEVFVPSPIIALGIVLKLPVVDVAVVPVMPTIEVGFDVELLSVIVDTNVCLPSVSIGMSPWWYWDQMREGD